MKILFICTSLEEGRDGIGDYTRKLSQEIFLQGASPITVSINDRFTEELQTGVKDNVPYYRIPARLSWKEKGDELIKILEANAPVDWISIQFVSYGFNSKGIIWNKKSFFDRLKPWKIHVQMHELWVAEEHEAPLKMRVLGKIQKQGILSFYKMVKPLAVTTTIPLYKKILEQSGIQASVAPLFSGIGYYTDKPAGFESKVPETLLNNRSKYIVGCLFGSIYNDSWDLTFLFKALKIKRAEDGKEIVIVSVGKISVGKDFWDSLPAKYPEINFVTLGLQDEQFISYWLNNFVDFGIITTPAIVAGKSSAGVAIMEHGIPVVCKQNELTFSFKVTDEVFDERIIQITETGDFELPERAEPTLQIKKIVQKFIQTLNSSK